MRRLHTGEALALGFEHCSIVVAAIGVLLLPVEPDRGQVFVADRLSEHGAVVICTERMLDGVTWRVESRLAGYVGGIASPWWRSVGKTLAMA